jgi:hypothetical protein
MTIRSNNDPRYSRKFLLMGIFVFGFALFCLYDGFIRYPGQRQHAYDEYIAAGGKEENWETWADEHKVRSQADIYMQFFMAAVAGLIAGVLFSVPLRLRGTWVEMTDTGITSSWRQSLGFEQIEILDKRKWRDKGIARITYLDDGRRRQFVLDDFKYDRPTMDAILYDLETHIGGDKITGGPPEPEREAHVQDAEPA